MSTDLFARIVALDPSTSATGVCVVDVYRGDIPARDRAVVLRWDVLPAPTVRSTKSNPLSPLRARRDRVKATRDQLCRWLSVNCEGAVDAVAVETITGAARGQSAHDANQWAVGALLTLSHFDGVEILGVARQSACKAVDAGSVFAQSPGKSSRDRADKRARLKQAVIDGVNARCGLELRPEQDAEADAIAVGLAAADLLWAREQAQKAKDAQTTMRLRKARTRKEGATA